jgi:predicted XRE-type DNA-binding protein
MKTEINDREIKKLLKNTSKMSKKSLKELRKSAKELENDVDFQTDCLSSLFVEEVLKIMKKQKVSKSELAKRLNTTKQQLNIILNEECTNFSLSALVNIASALNSRIEFNLIEK